MRRTLAFAAASAALLCGFAQAMPAASVQARAGATDAQSITFVRLVYRSAK